MWVGSGRFASNNEKWKTRLQYVSIFVCYGSTEPSIKTINEASSADAGLNASSRWIHAHDQIETIANVCSRLTT